MWETYCFHYYRSNERLRYYRTSPFAEDHDFSDAGDRYEVQMRETRVIDLAEPLKLRGNCRRDADEQAERCDVTEDQYTYTYHALHVRQNGRETRPQETWDCMDEWIKEGYGKQFLMRERGTGLPLAGVYWIIYQGAAYYASEAGRDAHVLIRDSLERLKACGVRYVEMGDVTPSDDPKANGIAFFKRGFGGKDQYYVLMEPR